MQQAALYRRQTANSTNYIVSRRDSRGMQQAALFRRESQFVVGVVLWFRLRESARSARDIGVHTCNDINEYKEQQ
jgi:hypothetical protein